MAVEGGGIESLGLGGMKKLSTAAACAMGIVLSIALTPCLQGRSAFADDSPESGDTGSVLTAQSTESRDIGSGSITCDQGGTLYRITGSSNKHTITVKGGTADNPVMVDLAGVTMKFQGAKDGDSTEAAPVTIEDNAYAIIYIGKDDATVVDTLTGGNEHGVGKNTGYAGICVKSNAHATIAGTGTLNVSGGGVEYGAAAIGGNYNDDVHDLTIDGGMTINATGGYSAPGIGSGRDGELYSLVIKSGTINATGGKYAPGIGAGDAVGTGGGGTTHNITITGGTITATGGYKAAGIGGSEGGSTGGIRIDGGTITATGGEEGAGIGGGSGGDVTAIYLTGGIITATGGTNAAGIGGGKGAKSGEITVAQGSSTALAITATGGENGAGIGSAAHDSDTIDITLAGGTITATGGHKGAGIGAGDADAGDISIKGTGTVNARSIEQACGIGAGDDSTASSITIEGAGSDRTLYINAEALTVTPTDPETAAKPEWWWANQAAAIGSARTECGPITISNATVNAAANGYGADIGGGNIHGWGSSSVQSITITNCAVTSQDFAGNVPQDKVAASIGAGTCGKVGTIAIYQSTVVGAGIGSSSSFYDDRDANSVDSITIQGSAVKAVRQDVGWEDDYNVYKCQSAGIGSGISGSVGSITITGSNVTAIGTGGGAGIGTGGVSGKMLEDSEKVYQSRIDTITIKDSTINATGSEQKATSDLTTGGAGIGVGFGLSGSGTDTTGTTLHAITIEGCESVTAKGGYGAAGIGTSYGARFSDGNLTITGSGVTATGGYGAAGIGAGEHSPQRGGDADAITINGASAVTATGGEGAAGIGGGSGCSVSSVTIALDSTADEKQYVHAAGGKGGAGIGSGTGGSSADSVSIQSGRVTATGGTDLGNKGTGAGIGGGNGKGALNNLSISGGIINASAGSSDAYDIGCGGTGSARTTDQNGTFTITGGTVLAASVGNAKTTNITGGSVLAPITGAVNGATKVYQTTLTLPNPANTKVDDLTTTIAYGAADIYSDSSSKVYLYLPASDDKAQWADLTVDSSNDHYYGTTTVDGKGILKMDGALAFKTPDELMVGGTVTLALDDANYSGQTFAFVVTKGTDVVSIDSSKSKTTAPGAYVTLDGLKFGDYTVTATSNTASDVYWPATATYFGKVTKAAGSITITENPSKTYDGDAVSDPAVTKTGDGAVTYTYYDADGTALSGAPKDAGTYSVKATMAATDHYTEATSELLTFSIAKKSVTLGLSASQASGTATVTASVLGMVDKEGSVSFAITGPSGDAKKDVAVSDDFTATTTYDYSSVSAGTYTVSVSLVDAKNYSAEDASQTYDVSQETRSITGVKASYDETYGDAAFKLSPKASFEGSKDSWTYTVVNDQYPNLANAVGVGTDGTVSINNAGRTVIKVTLVDGNNHYADAVAYTTVNVKRATLMVTPYAYTTDSSQHVTSIPYGQVSTLNYGLYYSDFVNGDTSATFTKDHGTLEAIPFASTLAAGDYQIAVKKVGKDLTIGGTTYHNVFLSRNYDITYDTSTLTVTKAPLTVAADDATGVWGTEPTYTYHFGNTNGSNALMAWDNVADVFDTPPVASLGTTKYDSLGIGEHDGVIQVTSGTLKDPANYSLVSPTLSGTLTITAAASNVAVSATSKPYDGTAATVSTTTAANYDGTVTLAYSRQEAGGSTTPLGAAPTGVGNYVVKAIAPATSHFEESTAQTSYSITQASPDLTLTAKSKPYDGTAATVTYTTAAGYDGTVALAYYQTDISGQTSGGTLLSGAPIKPGCYYVTATASGSKSGNYEDAATTSSFTIDKCASKPTVNVDSKTYDGNPDTAFAFAASDYDGTLTLAYYRYDASAQTKPASRESFVKLDGAPTGVGTYYAVAVASETDLYAGGFAWKEFSITAGDASLQVTLASRAYDGKPVSPIVTTAAFYDGTVAMAYYKTDASDATTGGVSITDAPTNVGHYYVTATAPDTANCTGGQATVAFDIEKAQGSISITGDPSKTYDGTAVSDPAVTKNGTGAVTYTYYAGSDTSATPLASAPSEVGDYTVVAVMAADDTYTSASASRAFTISEASDGGGAAAGGVTPNPVASPTAATGDQGAPLAVLFVVLAALVGALGVALLRRKAWKKR